MVFTDKWKNLSWLLYWTYGIFPHTFVSVSVETSVIVCVPVCESVLNLNSGIWNENPKQLTGISSQAGGKNAVTFAEVHSRLQKDAIFSPRNFLML